MSHILPQKYVSRHNREKINTYNEMVLFYRIEFVEAKTKISYDYTHRK